MTAPPGLLVGSKRQMWNCPVPSVMVTLVGALGCPGTTTVSVAAGPSPAALVARTETVYRVSAATDVVPPSPSSTAEIVELQVAETHVLADSVTTPAESVMMTV